MKVVYQGRPGAYGEFAALRALPQAETIACDTFEAVIRAVERGIGIYGVLPVHNTFTGAIEGNVQLIGSSSVMVIDDVRLPISHALIGLHGARLDKLQGVLSHPVALAQCRRFFEHYPWLSAVEHFDTAGSVEHIVQTGDSTFGAIAGTWTAESYGGRVLATDIAGAGINQTLFAVLASSRRPR